jgi:hypothetical protein
VKADPHPHVNPVGPCIRAHRPLDRQRRIERRRSSFEGGEEVVRTSVHLATTSTPHRGAHQPADIGEQGSVSIVEAPEQLGGALDIGQQEGDLPLRQLPLRLQLRADEADRHDPVLLRCPQQSRSRLVPRALVLEGHLTKPREGIPNVRSVVDRQTTSTARIDVSERAIWKLRSLLRAKRWHAQMIARTGSIPAHRGTASGGGQRGPRCSRLAFRASLGASHFRCVRANIRTRRAAPPNPWRRVRAAATPGHVPGGRV